MLNWAIIGSGDVVKRLVQNSLFVKNKSNVNCILSKDFNEAKKFGIKYNIKSILAYNKNNLQKILNDKNINSIYIATPPNSHFFYISFFCKKKINIVCEKPLLLGKRQINSFEKLIKKYKFNLCTCFYRRHLKKFLYIKNILKKKILGDIIYFDIKFYHSDKNHPTHNIIKGKKIPWRFVKKISGGGNVVDMGVHAIDLINFMLGKIIKMEIFKANRMNLYKVEDVCAINFLLANKVIGQSSWCSVVNEKSDLFSIYGNKASIHFTMNLGSDEKIKIIKNGKVFFKKFRLEQPLHKNMFNSFIKNLISNNKKNKFVIEQNGLENSKLLAKIINKSLVI